MKTANSIFASITLIAVTIMPAGYVALMVA